MRGPRRGKPLLAAGRPAFELESVIGDVGNAKGAIAGRGEKVRDPRLNRARSLAHVMTLKARRGDQATVKAPVSSSVMAATNARWCMRGCLSCGPQQKDDKPSHCHAQGTFSDIFGHLSVFVPRHNPVGTGKNRTDMDSVT
jgi:hypothetical protein